MSFLFISLHYYVCNKPNNLIKVAFVTKLLIIGNRTANYLIRMNTASLSLFLYFTLNCVSHTRISVWKHSNHSETLDFIVLSISLLNIRTEYAVSCEWISFPRVWRAF